MRETETTGVGRWKVQQAGGGEAAVRLAGNMDRGVSVPKGHRRGGMSRLELVGMGSEWIDKGE